MSQLGVVKVKRPHISPDRSPFARARTLDDRPRLPYFECHQTIKMRESVFTALADPTRRKILKLLRRGSKSAGELAERFTITKGSLSHHFNVLKAADLVRSERRGQQILYSLNTSVFEEVEAMLLSLFRVDGKGG
jgi:DNA-binding transcriptional ArsR family regulator